MATIRVWAPFVDQIEIDSGGKLITMKRSDCGWWSVDAPHIEHGNDYAFLVDGRGPFPDPRSSWQPEGVNGLSRWVDHSNFTWHDSDWQPPPVSSAVFYELHVGTYTPEGTFAAILEKLDHLKDLGITHVELMPVAHFPGSRGWGYDGVDLYAPHHAYGGPEGLKTLVDACHQRGLAVMLDVVYNHLGPLGNYLSQYGPYFSQKYKTPWGEAVNFDGPESDEVRRFFIDNALMWLREYHIDGLRIDAVHAIFDMSAIHFLEQLAAEVELLEGELGRHLLLIAESDLNDPRIIRPVELGGYGIDGQWNEDFHHALHSVLTGERSGYYLDFGPISDLAKVLTEGLANDGRYSPYRRRRHGRPATGISAHQFIGCLQNHDQVGNRALGDRTSHLLNPGQLKIGAALTILGPFLPMLFMGEEWAASSPFLYFTDHPDPQLGEALRNGRREEFAAFGWDPEKIPDPQDEQTFLTSGLDWSETSKSPHADLHTWYKQLLALRKSHRDLSDGRLGAVGIIYDEDQRWLVMRRGEIQVICNFADKPQTILSREGGQDQIILASQDGIILGDNMVSLPEHAVAVVIESKQ